MDKPLKYGLIDHEVMYDEALSVNAKALYGILCCHANDDLQCWPGIEKLRLLLGVSEKTVRRAMTELVEREIVERQKAKFYKKTTITVIRHGVSFRKGIKYIGPQFNVATGRTTPGRAVYSRVTGHR